MAEFIGTFWLVFGGCGSAVLAAVFGAKLEGTPVNIGISHLGVVLRIRPDGADHGLRHRPHLGLSPEPGRVRRARRRRPLPVQGSGALRHRPGAGRAGAGRPYFTSSLPARHGFTLADGFAANGYAEHSPGKYSLVACLAAEVVLTFMFLMIILGSTDRRAPAGFAPIAIGLGLTLIHLIGIPVTNLSVNPARSTGPAVFVGGWALAQLWLFWVAPILGAACAGVVYRSCFETGSTSRDGTRS